MGLVIFVGCIVANLCKCEFMVSKEDAGMMEIFNLSYAEQKQQDIADQVRDLYIRQEGLRRKRGSVWVGLLKFFGRILLGKDRKAQGNPSSMLSKRQRFRHGAGIRKY